VTNHLRILTYNIHKCRGLDGRVRPGRIVELLQEIDPDIAALQEVLTVAGSGGRERDQARFVAEELGFYSCMGENRRLNGGGYGNLLLSRFPLRAIENYDITVPGREQRGCLHADVDLDGTALHFFNVHLGTSFFERRHQARKLLGDQILQNRNFHGPRVVFGDFNEWTRGLASRLFSQHFQSVDIRAHLGHSRTYPSLVPLFHLDHIYFDPALKLKDLALHKSRTALIASDHLPLFADFELRSITPIALQKESITRSIPLSVA
jgi:endonuclease/exonuclease/phosphatase family metal-dependent hydrolase